MVDIKIDFGIADIIRELREWWERAKARGDAARDQTTRSSARKLAVGFVQMAGLLDNFADQLDRVPIEGSHPSASTVQAREIGRELQGLLHSMQATLADIETALHGIDLSWAVTNLGVLDDASSLFRVRSMAVGRIEALVLTLADGEAVLIERYDFDRLGKRLRELAGDGRRVAEEISRTCKQTPQSRLNHA